MFYGFSSTEFAALLIVAGLSSDNFTAKGISSSINYVDTMHLADYGPFSQIVLFDPHAGTKIIKVELKCLIHEAPVRVGGQDLCDVPLVMALWGWLHDQQETNGNFISNFRRGYLLDDRLGVRVRGASKKICCISELLSAMKSEYRMSTKLLPERIGSSEKSSKAQK